MEIRFFFKVFGHQTVPFFWGSIFWSQQVTAIAQTLSAVLACLMTALSLDCDSSQSQVLHSPAFQQHFGLTTVLTNTEKNRDKAMGLSNPIAWMFTKYSRVNPEMCVRQGIRSIWVFI
ncbi:hypothetical protein [Limnohabitans sp. DM1]|uniref:hypothetical protein n=1 Tax=Limnohabitans sp. DM1 TaxID=1597955 RepID=UPI000B7EC134|nr:hypothetical protein [Limnohabitans sp. DM1]